MKPTLLPLLTIAALVTANGCAHHEDLRRPSTQDNFGVQMAKMNLWREAMFRFERAVQIKPDDAMAHNNLAVAYEANGDFEKARQEYLEALKLDRSNQYIQKNYSRFVEFLSRNKKREPKPGEASGTKTAAATEPAGTPSVSSAIADETHKPAAAAKPSDIPPPPTVPPTAVNPNPTPPPQSPPGGRE